MHKLEAHPLIRRAHRHRPRAVQAQPAAGFVYDLRRGGWISDDAPGTYLVRTDLAGVPRPMTKKEDMETGEDQKGA